MIAAHAQAHKKWSLEILKHHSQPLHSLNGDKIRMITILRMLMSEEDIKDAASAHLLVVRVLMIIMIRLWSSLVILDLVSTLKRQSDLTKVQDGDSDQYIFTQIMTIDTYLRK